MNANPTRRDLIDPHRRKNESARREENDAFADELEFLGKRQFAKRLAAVKDLFPSRALHVRSGETIVDELRSKSCVGAARMLQRRAYASLSAASAYEGVGCAAGAPQIEHEKLYRLLRSAATR
jgi:hypothetical protein